MIPPFLLSLITAIVGFIWPAAPAWLPKMIATALPASIEIVAALESRLDLSGSQRFALATEGVGELLDEALDEVPEWRELSEARRDRILAGLVELALFSERVGSRAGGKADVRRTVRKIRDMERPVPSRAPVG